jgi:hypothetical protein
MENAPDHVHLSDNDDRPVIGDEEEDRNDILWDDHDDDDDDDTEVDDDDDIEVDHDDDTEVDDLPEVEGVRRSLQRSIHKQRDNFFHADHENLLLKRTTTRTGEIITQEHVIGYRPKYGDFSSNLQRFLENVNHDEASQIDRFDCSIVVWVGHDQGFCIINSENFVFEEVSIVWKEIAFSAAFAVVGEALARVSISVYLQRGRAVNCDQILQAVSNSLPANESDFFNSIHYEVEDSVLSLRGGRDPLSTCLVGDCLSSTAMQNCLETLAAKNVPFQLDERMLLSDEQWKAVQRVENLMLDSSIPVPASVWREIRALKVAYWNGERNDDETDLQALSAIGERRKPLAHVLFDRMPAASLVGFEEALLGAFGGVISFELVQGFHCSLKTWTKLWLSDSLQTNNTLVRLDIWLGADGEGPADVRYLEAIRACLQANCFLQEFKWWHQRLVGDALVYWRANIEPLLELNRSHCPRLEPNEQRRSVLHDALIRVRNHPMKLYNLLLKYPHAFTRIVLQERVEYLERSHKETLRVKTTLQIENALLKLRMEELHRRVRAQQRQINDLDLIHQLYGAEE